MFADILRDARYAFRQTAEDARLHHRRHADARARHRRDERDLQRRQRRAAAAAAVSGAGRAGAGQRDRAAVRPLLGRAGNFLDWRAQNTVFERIAAYTAGSATLHRTRRRRARAERRGVVGPVRAAAASRPRSGAGSTQTRTYPARTTSIVLSHGMWQRRFGGDPQRAGARGHAQRRAGDDRRRDACRTSTSRARRRVLARRSPSTRPTRRAAATSSASIARLKAGRDRRAGRRRDEGDRRAARQQYPDDERERIGRGHARCTSRSSAARGRRC